MWLWLGLIGCLAPCGTLTVTGTTGYDGAWTEVCGVGKGTSGAWNTGGDGFVDVRFAWAGRGEGADLADDIDVAVSFDGALLTSGTTITDLDGSAQINACPGCAADFAELVEGQIEVGPGDDGIDPCLGDGPAWKLTWDLTFGEMYHASGADRVRFLNAGAATCGR